MKWIKFLPVIICLATAANSIAEEVQKAQEDGKVTVDEILQIVDDAVGKAVQCLLGRFGE